MKIATIIGARPQFIKAAVISRAIEEHNLHNSSPVIEKSVKSGDMMLHRVPIFPIPRGLFRHHRPEELARLLLTDSSGMQKEAYWLAAHCLKVLLESRFPTEGGIHNEW